MGSGNPRLRLLLEEILPRKGFFQKILNLRMSSLASAKRTIVLSARRVDELQRILPKYRGRSRRAAPFSARIAAFGESLPPFVRTAKDGILIVDPKLEESTECKSFYSRKLLGYESQ
jgi:hypothetical protein